MRMFKKFVALLLLATAMLLVTVPVFAATKPYTDVTVEYWGRDVYKAVKYIKKHSGFKGVIKGTKFYPEKVMTRKEFLKILVNLYGKKRVPITATDRKKYKKPIRAQWVINKLNAVLKKSRKKGVIDWRPANFKVPRHLAVCYIYGYLYQDFRMKPQK
ncbi:hypothetical protein IKE98_00215 [Candidatus Saccharibacteria bacterium]|nr:hypothetical protein [Candidatus Saccharibacteria bacterium]